MITLAIDTSTGQGAVAVLDDDRPIAEEHFGRDGLFDAILRLHLDRFDRLVVGGSAPDPSPASGLALRLPKVWPCPGRCRFAP